VPALIAAPYADALLSLNFTRYFTNDAPFNAGSTYAMVTSV
jgi:hypothetical protein